MIVPGRAPVAAAANEIVLDTNSVIHIYFAKNKAAKQWFRQAVNQNQPFILSIVVIQELMYLKNPQGGFLVRKRDIPIVRNLLNRCRLDLPTLDDRNKALARVEAVYSRGKLSFPDAPIAECALRNNAQVCIYDSDFIKSVPELSGRIIQPYPDPNQP